MFACESLSKLIHYGCNSNHKLSMSSASARLSVGLKQVISPPLAWLSSSKWVCRRIPSLLPKRELMIKSCIPQAVSGARTWSSIVDYGHFDVARQYSCKLKLRARPLVPKDAVRRKPSSHGGTFTFTFLFGKGRDRVFTILG